MLQIHGITFIFVSVSVEVDDTQVGLAVAGGVGRSFILQSVDKEVRVRSR